MCLLLYTSNCLQPKLIIYKTIHKQLEYKKIPKAYKNYTLLKLFCEVYRKILKSECTYFQALNLFFQQKLFSHS